LPRLANQDENDPNNNEPGVTNALVPTPIPKKIVIKKRSTALVRLINEEIVDSNTFYPFSILHHRLLLINMNLAKKWVMEISRLFIVQNYVVLIVNMLLKSLINQR
jgi:hypothetical protein